jgi:hypothetical protein
MVVQMNSETEEPIYTSTECLQAEILDIQICAYIVLRRINAQILDRRLASWLRMLVAFFSRANQVLGYYITIEHSHDHFQWCHLNAVILRDNRSQP